MTERCAIAVIGAGFFGCEIALALDAAGHGPVLLIDEADAIMTRASYVNQARIHNGYHYPRALPTAARSRLSFRRFASDYAHAVHRGGATLYAIARDSLTTPAQFERFCRRIGADYRPLGPGRADIFDPGLIDEAYLVEEHAFDSLRLAAGLRARLERSGVTLRLATRARIGASEAGGVVVETGGGRVVAGHVFNCTYGAIDRIGVPLGATIKRELAEVALIEPGPGIPPGGITVMDGPFFSTMPFPARGCFSLTHVRYTPHAAWTRLPGETPRPAAVNAGAMLRDAARYVPAMRQARYLGSLFELKAVLAASEGNDARPILFERAAADPRIVSVLGAKIDNIYDALDYVRGGGWMGGSAAKSGAG